MTEREAGFTLIEMLVALVMVLLVFSIGGSLFLEAGRTMAHSAARAMDERADLAGELLRRDLRGARSVEAPLGLIWSSADLVIQAPNGSRVTWAQLENRLTRRDSASGDVWSRTLLDDLVLWRWRVLPGGLIEVELTLRRFRSPFVRSAGSTRVRPDRGQFEVLRFAMASRAGRQGRW